MDTDILFPPITKIMRHFRNAAHQTSLFASILGLALLAACSSGCAPSSSQESGNRNSSDSSASKDLPEITEDLIRERINGARIRKVPEEHAAAEAISWTFDEDEPKEIVVVEKQTDGTRATLLLDIKTKSAPGAGEPRYLAGQIRTDWELQTGWVLRKWEIVKTENVSMTYKNLPKPRAQNSNR